MGMKGFDRRVPTTELSEYADTAIRFGSETEFANPLRTQRQREIVLAP